MSVQPASGGENGSEMMYESRTGLIRVFEEREIRRWLGLHKGFAPIWGLIPFPPWRGQPTTPQEI
jgi:hypothetical protein